MPRHAPASMLIWAGSGTACSVGSTIHSAAVPKGRRHWPFQTQTRSPTRDGETPSPTRSISPAPSLCGMTRGKAILRVSPPRRVEMSDNLVQQQHRREARHFRKEARVGQNEANEQRLLFAGRGLGGGNLLVRVSDEEIGKVRPFERAAGGGVARAIGFEQ